jgi:integral membrane protein (TIGR01906 family)
VRRVSTWLVGLALAVFLLGASVVPLTIPAFTRLTASRVSLAEDAGLSQERMLEVAEQVRRFVVANDGPTLPATVDGRPGFDEAAVSHLLDVRRVLSAARILTGVLALALAVGLAYEVARKRTERVADALMAGAVCSVVLVVLCAVAAASDFDTFFSAFHGLFFSAGTWTFPYDSLLIRTFPEPFWVSAGAVWGGLVLAGAGVLALVAGVLRRGSAGGSK